MANFKDLKFLKYISKRYCVFSTLIVFFYMGQIETTSQMDLHKLHELGKEKLVKYKYSEAIKIYQEIKRKNPNDPVFSPKPRKKEEYQGTPKKAKVYYDEAIIKYVDLPLTVIDQLNKLTGVYVRAGDYETALIILRELRKTYVEEPWDQDQIIMYKEGKLIPAPYKSEYYRFMYDLITLDGIARILEKQNKIQESIVEYHKILSIINDPLKMRIFPENKKTDLIQKIEDRTKGNIRRLEK